MGLVSWDRKGPLLERALEIVGWGRQARSLIINTFLSSSFKCYLSPSPSAFAKVVQIYRHWAERMYMESIGDSGLGGAEAPKLCR